MIIHDERINAVIRTVIVQEKNNPHIQLTILTRALVRAAKIIGADQVTVMDNLVIAWGDEPETTSRRRMQ